MLWHPIAYIVLILPFAAARFSSLAGASVPSAVVIFTAAVFGLSGFVNAVLFCTARNVLPGAGGRYLVLEPGWAADEVMPSRLVGGIQPGPRIEYGARMGAAGRRRSSIVLSISVEKEVEIKYGEGEKCPSSFKCGLNRDPETLRGIAVYGYWGSLIVQICILTYL
jgi:hypothetical protein